MIEAFEKTYGLRIIQAWGMTEMSPLGTTGHLPSWLVDAPEEATLQLPRQAGTPGAVRRNPRPQRRAASSPGTARRWASSRCADRGSRRRTTTATTAPTASPTMAGSRPAISSRSTSDATIQIQDRSKDLIKSGGEWISSVALECALMGHPAVAEAAVIPVMHPKWAERPLAAVVLKPGANASPSELRAIPRAAVPEVLAAGRVRVRRRHSAHVGRQVQEERAARAVQGLSADGMNGASERQVS